MALIRRYMVSTMNLPEILKKVVDGAPPDRFTTGHLKSLGFKSSNDQPVIGLLKELNFLTDDGTPTSVYHAYRNRSQSRRVLGEAIRESYSDLFTLSERPTTDDRADVEGMFMTTLGSTNSVAKRQAQTFFALLELADLPEEEQSEDRGTGAREEPTPREEVSPLHKEPIEPSLHYNIQIHLPATRDVEVSNAIFRSLKENVLA